MLSYAKFLSGLPGIGAPWVWSGTSVSFTLPKAYAVISIMQNRFTLQIFIVILLCKSIKSMEKMYELMIGKIFRKNYHCNLDIVKQL